MTKAPPPRAGSSTFCSRRFSQARSRRSRSVQPRPRAYGSSPARMCVGWAALGPRPDDVDDDDATERWRRRRRRRHRRWRRRAAAGDDARRRRPPPPRQRPSMILTATATPLTTTRRVADHHRGRVRGSRPAVASASLPSPARRAALRRLVSRACFVAYSSPRASRRRSRGSRARTARAPSSADTTVTRSC